MKLFPMFSLVVSVPFLIVAGSDARAQVRQSPPSAAQPQDETKPLHKQRDSGAARETGNTSGVEARRKANSAPTAPDTSYNTIITTTPSSSGTSAAQTPTGTNVPESMRIQQDTVRDLPPRRDLITKGGGTSAAPGAMNSSVERNRIDASAPSRQRLQVDDLSAVRSQQPNANNIVTPPIDPTVRGAADGSGSGTSGSSVLPASPNSSAGPSGTASSASHSSGGSSSSGGGH